MWIPRVPQGFRWNGIRIPAQSELAGISLRLSDSKSHALVCVSPDLVFSPESRRQRLRDHAALPEGVGHRVRVSLCRWSASDLHFPGRAGIHWSLLVTLT